MLIRLSKPSVESGGGVVKPLAADTVTVACPEHLVLADLPVAKGIGTASATSVVKTVGRRSRRQLGERVHFCVRCDFPIAIYGRLSPCEHVFCLDCARSDSICYLCDERIQKIQTIKIMEGIFICAAPHCLKSFLKRTEFESHIQEIHADLLQPDAEENGNDSEVQSAKQQSVSESTARAPSKPLISPVSSSQFPDFEDKTFRQQPSEQSHARSMVQLRPPSSGQGQDYPSDNHPDNSCLPGFDHPGGQNHPQRSMQWGPQQASSHLPDKQQGNLSEYPPMHPIQPPNFGGPLSSNPMMTPQYGVPPFQHEGGHPFYGAQYEMAQMARPDSVSEAGAEQGSLFGFPPGSVGSSFMSNYSQPWRTGPGGQGIPAAFPNMSDSQGNVAFHQGDNVHKPGVFPIVHPPPSANQGMEAVQGGNAMDTRDSKGKWETQQFPHQPPPPPPPPVPHMSQPKRGEHYPGDMGHDGQSFGWQRENRDGFGSGRE